MYLRRCELETICIVSIQSMHVFNWDWSNELLLLEGSLNIFIAWGCVFVNHNHILLFKCRVTGFKRSA